MKEQPIRPQLERIDKDKPHWMDTEDVVVRPHFLTSKFNLETAKKRMKSVKNAWSIILFLLMIGIIAYVLWHK